jgi:hypothetical protein
MSQTDKIIQPDKITALLKHENVSSAAKDFADKIAKNETLMEKILQIIADNPGLNSKRNALTEALYNLKGGRNRRTKKTKYSSKQIRSKHVNKKHKTKSQN